MAEYIATIGTAVNSIIALEAPGWTGAAQVNTLLTQAEADAANWKAGTPSQDFVTVLGELASAIDTIPTNPKTDALIAIAVAAIDGITAIVTAESTAPTVSDQVATFDGWLDAGSTPPPAKTRKHVWNGKQPKSQKQFKKLWNQNAPANAKLK